jgi:hypothetical protein
MIEVMRQLKANVNEEVEDATPGCLGVLYTFLLPPWIIPRRSMARFRIDQFVIKRHLYEADEGYGVALGLH